MGVLLFIWLLQGACKDSHDFCCHTKDFRSVVPPDALINAICEGNAFKAQGLVLAGVDLNRRRDSDGLAALHLATMQGWVGLVRRLLSGSANVNLVCSHDCSTALHFAVAKSGHLAIVRLLLEGAATVNTANAKGVTPLGASVVEGSLEIARALVQARAAVDPGNCGDTEIVLPATILKIVPVQSNSDKEIVREFLKTTSDQELTDREPTSPPRLMRTSTWNGRTAQLLLEQDNRAKRRPVYISAKSGGFDSPAQLSEMEPATDASLLRSFGSDYAANTWRLVARSCPTSPTCGNSSGRLKYTIARDMKDNRTTRSMRCVAPPSSLPPQSPSSGCSS